MPQGLALASLMAAAVPPMAAAAPALPTDNGSSFVDMLHTLDGTAFAGRLAAAGTAPGQPGRPALPMPAPGQSGSAGAAVPRAAAGLPQNGRLLPSAGRGGALDPGVMSTDTGNPPVLPVAQADGGAGLVGEVKPADRARSASAGAAAQSPPLMPVTEALSLPAEPAPLATANATEPPASLEDAGAADAAADQTGVPSAFGRGATGGRLAATPTQSEAAAGGPVASSSSPHAVARRLHDASDRIAPPHPTDASATGSGRDGAAVPAPGAESTFAAAPPEAGSTAPQQPRGASADGRDAQPAHPAEPPGSGLAVPQSLSGTAGAAPDARPADTASAGAGTLMPSASSAAVPPPADGLPALPALSALPPSAASGQGLSSAPSNATDTPQDTGAPATGAGHQVSAALVSLSAGGDGTQRMTLRLEPAELGQVQIRIDRAPDAPARVDITVERPETMTLLLRDQPQLQRALDVAGVPTDGRSLTLHLATPDLVAPSAGTQGGMAANAGSGQGGGNGSGARSGGQGGTEESADTAPDDTTAALPRWLRAGLDITA